MNLLQTKLTELKACEDAIEWCKDYDDLQSAWDNCKRSDWMLWLLEKIDYKDDKALRLIVIDCARQVQRLMKDVRSTNALDVAEKYVNGKATDEELAAASDAAWDAARDAASDAARDAAKDAVRDAAWAAARDAAWAAQSKIIRNHIKTISLP
jgi:hypothetical protein